MHKMRCRVVLLVFATVCCTITSQASRENALMETMPVYSVALRADVLNSTTCRRELEQFRDGVDRRIVWAVNVLDSSGSPKPGFMDGNNYWLGSRGQCEDLSNRVTIPVSRSLQKNNTRFRNPKEEFPPYPVQYVVAYIRHGSTLQYNAFGSLLGEDKITLGICVPVSCSTEELSAILKRIFRDRTLLFGDLYLTDLKLVEVKNLRDDHRWLLEPRFFIIGFTLTVTVLLVIAGTVFDVTVHQKRLKSKQKLLAYENNNAAEQKQDTEEPEFVGPEHETTFQRVLLSFSIYTNTEQIFKTKLGKDNISSIHGLRFFGMVWIIMVHTIFYAIDFAENKIWQYRATRGFLIQIMANATYAVDSFFFFSGFLLSYLFFKSQEKRKDCKPYSTKTKIYGFLLMLFKRYVRLTPAYIMVVGLAQLNWGWYDKVSVFQMSEGPQVTCAKYWWRNILYINNFFKREEMCLSWSWYLSNDTQFFIVGALILLLSTTYFYLACFILCALLVGSMISSGYISYSLHYVPTLDEQYRLLATFYDPPWMRIGPYIVGIIVGYLLVKSKNKLNLNKKALAVLWCLGLSCNVVVLFMTYNKEMSPFIATLYSALSRTVWGLGTAWIVTACCTNNGGVVNSILSFKGWVPLSKLTYCAYLLNPIIISSTYLHSESSVHFTTLQAGTQFLGMTVCSYMAAYVFTLLLEMPYVLLMRTFLNNRIKAT